MAGDVTLDVGHVVTVEPGIYLPGKYGCRIEDMICVTEDKQVVDLTHSNKELIELL
jgi:Xaa-Pro aminopeptidase